MSPTAETETTETTTTTTTTTTQKSKPWIRGVNLGGWLVLERPWTPYLFALSDCDLRGDYRYFPHQIDAPRPGSAGYGQYKRHHPDECQFVETFPVDEWTLCTAFIDAAVERGESATIGRNRAREYLRIHYDNFVTYEDLLKLKAAGATHLRVPLPHWILGDVSEDEPYVSGGGWEYFLRLAAWVREIGGLELWPDVHTAPGSQNGFDNSGRWNVDGPTCQGWTAGNLTNVARSLRIVDSITSAIAREGLTGIVTGFGPINEPFVDCDRDVVKKFYDDSLEVIRSNMGQDTAVYIGDLFNSTKFREDGYWTAPEEKYEETFLDSHYYHVFAEETRALSPRQHIAYVCRKNHRDTVGCCYDEPDERVDTADDHDDGSSRIRKQLVSPEPHHSATPSRGISRMVGEWSASYDTLVSDMLELVMDNIRKEGVAYRFERQLGAARSAFVRRYVEAQMVTYEAAASEAEADADSEGNGAGGGVSRGWFFWTFKTEGGAFAEWDFLRGISEGWIPRIPHPTVASVSLHGTCEDILFATSDDPSHGVIETYPPATPYDPTNWQGVIIDDDVVVSHGQSLLDEGGGGFEPVSYDDGYVEGYFGGGGGEGGGYGREGGDTAVGLYLCLAFAVGAVGVGMFAKRKKGGYTEIDNGGDGIEGRDTKSRSMEMTV